VKRLEESGLLLVTEAEHLIPGRDLQAIKLTDIFDAVRGGRNRSMQHIRSVPIADQVAASADDAMRSSVKDRTLADLLVE
jgi:hypothetical protein